MRHPTLPLGGRLVSVDILRALAALAVVVSHVPLGIDETTAHGKLLAAGLRMGRLGVPLFLVLSGFCIHLGAARGLTRPEGPRADWVGFWKRRWWRLYPAYLAAILLSVVLYGLAGPAAFPAEERITAWPWDLLTHLLLLHNLFEAYCFSLGNGPFWTLGLEEQLYLLYVPFLALRRGRGLAVVLGVTLFVSLAWQCGWRALYGPDDGAAMPTVGPEALALGRWLKWAFGFWFAWAMGALAAEAYTGAVRLPGWCYGRAAVLLLAALGLATSHAGLTALFGRAEGGQLAVMGVLSGLSDLAFAAAGFVILNRWVRLESAGWFQGRFALVLAGVGVMSYSLYLTHVPLVRLLVSWLPAEGLAAGLLRMAVVVPACLLFATAFFWLVERHFLKRPAPAAAGG